MITQVGMPERGNVGTRAQNAVRLALLTFLFSMTAYPDSQLTLFNSEAESAAQQWEVVNDGVMGGVSSSQFLITNGIALFTGKVSLENNGGFASVRLRADAMDCAGCDAFVIRVRGDGKTYKFTARTSRSWNSPQYQMKFNTRADEWQEIRLPLEQFKASFRGRALPGEPPLTSDRLTSLGFLIADKQVGLFRLEIRSIRMEKMPGQEG